MRRLISPRCFGFWMLTAVWFVHHPALAAAPSVQQALKLAPIQAEVDYDRPGEQDIAKCKLQAQKIDGQVGWIVESPDGAILRRFVDTNGDNVVDQWSYFKGGLEVYRDIDSNFNGKADQYRWFHSGGSRWALDANEDGAIDSWKSISAEEVSAEVVAALAARDAERFARLLLAPAELKSLGLGAERAKSIAEKTSRAAADFKAMAARQKTVSSDAAWVQFSAGKPGVAPAGTDGSTRDLRVHENVAAIVESGGKHAQVQIGTMVLSGDAWRLIDLPIPDGEEQADSAAHGLFHRASVAHRVEPAGGASGAGETMQKLLSELEKLDQETAGADSPEEQAQAVGRRADLLEKIAAEAKNADERAMWLRQLADMIGAAVQSGACPDGADRLEVLYKKLDASNADKTLAGYVRFRQLTADYVRDMQAPKADYAKIQKEWLNTLEQYINDFPASTDAAEAMLQLAISQEFAGQDDEAKKWYVRVGKEFPNSQAAKQGVGALARLDSVGRTIALEGQSPLGSRVDLAAYRGKVVLIHYWASWSTPAKNDMALLKEFWNKYGRQLAIIGVNLDNNAKDLNAYLAENPLPWPQIHEPGGLDSRPANALGILTVPTTLLVDQQGKVVDRNAFVSEVEPEIKKLLK